MSLKGFHIVFVTASVLLAAGFALWSLARFREDGGAIFIASALVSLAAVPVLIAYGVRFWLRLRDIGFFG